MKINTIKTGSFIAILLFLFLPACKKEKKNSETKFEDDGRTEERMPMDAFKAEHAKLGTGAFKALLDTNNLNPLDKYTVVFVPSFQEPIVLNYVGSDDDKASKAAKSERDLMTKSKADFPDMVIADTANFEWHSTFFCGFTGNLTPYQVKELYKDNRIDYIARDFDYETYGAVTYSNGTKPLFVHGYKKPSSTTKKIWIIDTGGDLFAPQLNTDKTYSKSFMVKALNDDADHGNCVAGVAAASEYPLNNCRGTAEGALIVLLKAGNGTKMNWNAVNNALAYCWKHSKRGDIVNLSFGTKAFDLTETMEASIAQMESNILKFKNWDMPVVMAAGNNDDYSSRYSPCRLGMMYKDDPTNYKFLHVVANIRPTGTEAQIKDGSTKFELNNNDSKPSNFGRAVRWGVMGTWQVVRTNGSAFVTSGTSFSAPALCGILYHQNVPLADPSLTVYSLNYKKSNTYYSHLVPKYE